MACISMNNVVQDWCCLIIFMSLKLNSRKNTWILKAWGSSFAVYCVYWCSHSGFFSPWVFCSFDLWAHFQRTLSVGFLGVWLRLFLCREILYLLLTGALGYLRPESTEVSLLSQGFLDSPVVWICLLNPSEGQLPIMNSRWEFFFFIAFFFLFPTQSSQGYVSC